MAKLGTYYGLCPLIDHRNLLGISEGEESGVVIVTLGKNIAIKYKLSDQKQLHSWRTKEKFTSPIIFIKDQLKYAAVFNESFVRMWTGDEEFLDKLKKFKFNQQIYTIFTCNGKSFVVFKNGSVHLLKESIDNRKELNPINIIDVNTENISDVVYTALNEDVYVAVLVSSDEKSDLYWTKFNAEDTQDKFSKVCLHRDNFSLSGYVFHINKSTVNFLSLWNDGRIYSLELKESDVESTDVGELFAVAELISCKEYVSMITLDQNYLALYGCNSNEEGALLVIYNVQFKVIQSRQPFKLFTNGAKMWRIEGNLLFPVGQNLAVVPFYLANEQLAALVGSHKVTNVDLDEEVSIVQKIQLASWDKQSKTQDTHVPELLESKIRDFMDQGLSENSIFAALLLDIIDQQDIETFSQSLKYFSEIPEKCLADMLKFVLNLESHLFKSNIQCSETGYPSTMQPLQRAEFLDWIFTKSFNETLFLPHLRSTLTLNEALVLLQYIHFLLSENGHLLPLTNSFESEAKLIEWSCILIDANYQKFLLTRDENITNVIVSLRNLIKEETNSFDDLKYVCSLLTEMSRGKSVHKAIHVGNLNYSIEEFPLY